MSCRISQFAQADFYNSEKAQISGQQLSDICVSIEEKNSFLAQETFEFLCNRFQLHNNIRLQGWRQVDGWLGFLYEKRVLGRAHNKRHKSNKIMEIMVFLLVFFCAMGIIVCPDENLRTPSDLKLCMHPILIDSSEINLSDLIR